MLSFFPAPYPDELLYSVLSRYHLLSGNRYPAFTNSQLFGTEGHSINFLYAFKGLRYMVGELPSGVVDIKSLVDSHTLTPYVLRFAPKKRKREVYDYLLTGAGSDRQTSNSFLTMRQFMPSEENAMRYCPKCVIEDRKKYGEAYWHCTHQIQLLPICDIHGCNLVDSPLLFTAENKRRYQTAEEVLTDIPEPHWSRDYYIRPLANTLVTFLRDPLSLDDDVDDGFWCDALADELIKNGFGKIKEDGSFKLSIPKGADKVVDVYEALCGYYGREIVSRYLEQQTRFVLGLLAHNGILRAPEQYALVSTALGTDPHKLTIPGYEGRRKKGQYITTKQYKKAPLYTREMLIDDEIAEKMREMAGRGYLWNKRRVAEILHLDMQKLTYYAEIRGIAPFWVNGSPEHVVNRSNENWHQIKIFVTDEMFERIKQRSHELGMYRYIEYARYCMEKELTEAGYPKKPKQ